MKFEQCCFLIHVTRVFIVVANHGTPEMQLHLKGAFRENKGPCGI